MPLIKGSSRETISANIREMSKTHPQKQAIAAALDMARKYRQSGGAAQQPWFVRHEAERMLKGPTMGRADKINTSVPNNSFIVPSHVVSALGQGNTLAGQTVLGKMFPSNTVKVQKPNFPKLPGAPKLPKMPGMAHGGEAHDKVPVALSDGEFRIEPHHVLRIGHGDYERGHRILKHFCVHVKHKLIDDLKRLPDPVDSGEE